MIIVDLRLLQVGDERGKALPDLPDQVPHAHVPPQRQEPVPGDEHLAVRVGGEAGELVLELEHGHAGAVVPAPERRERDHLLRHALEPLRHVHLRLAATLRQLVEHPAHGVGDEGHERLEVLGVERGGEDAAVAGPRVAVEVAEAVALELADERVRLVPVEVLRPRQQHLTDQLRRADRQPRLGPEPDQMLRTCTI